MSINGFGLAEVTARNDFRVTIDATGRVKGSQSFSLRHGAYDSERALFLKGNTLATVNPDAPDPFGVLLIESHEFEENGGGNGIDIVTLQLVGWFEGDEGQTERETIYDLNTTLSERPTIEHPKFVNIGVPADKDFIVKLYNGTARWNDESGTVTITDVYSGFEIGTITDGQSLQWFDLIIRRGVRTYNEPVSEYTETRTDQGGLSDAKVADMGKIDTPPNNPPSPPDKIWMMSGASETKSSDNPVTWTRTWMTIDDTPDNNLLYEP
jgi:hypothetical protein